MDTVLLFGQHLGALEPQNTGINRLSFHSCWHDWRLSEEFNHM